MTFYIADSNSDEYIRKVIDRKPTSGTRLLFKVTSRSHEVDHIDQCKCVGMATVPFTLLTC